MFLKWRKGGEFVRHKEGEFVKWPKYPDSFIKHFLLLSTGITQHTYNFEMRPLIRSNQ